MVWSDIQWAARDWNNPDFREVFVFCQTPAVFEPGQRIHVHTPEGGFSTPVMIMEVAISGACVGYRLRGEEPLCVWESDYLCDSAVAAEESEHLRLAWKRHRDHRTIRAVAVSTDGQSVAAGDIEGLVSLRQAASGEEDMVLRGHADGISALAFIASNQRLLSGSWDGTLRLWSREGECLRVYQGHERAISAAVISPEGERFASSSWDGTLRIWSLADNRQLALLPSPGITALAWGNERLATGDEHGHVALLRVGTTELQLAMILDSDMTPLGRKTRAVSQRKTEKDRPIFMESNANPPERRLTRGISALSFSPDNQRLVSGSWDGAIRCWSTAGYILQQFRGHRDRVTGFAFSPDGLWLASAGWDSILRLSHGETGQMLSAVCVYNNYTLAGQGNLLALSGRWGQVSLYRVEAERAEAE